MIFQNSLQLNIQFFQNDIGVAFLWCNRTKESVLW